MRHFEDSFPATCEGPMKIHIGAQRFADFQVRHGEAAHFPLSGCVFVHLKGLSRHEDL